jgi:hypothetical protein
MNPLLERIKLPGRIFQLPSRGVFYTSGEVDASIVENDGEIHVQALSALDEITLKNPDQLFSGDAVNTVFRDTVTGLNNPRHLLSKDVDAIMLFSRVVTYGPNYEFLATHTCPDAKEHSYVADLDVVISGMKIIDPTTLQDKYTVNLTNGQVIKLRPTRYQQTVDFIKRNSNKKELTIDDQKSNLISILLDVIVSVDGIDDKSMIKEWIEKLPTRMVNRIAEKIEGINDWGSSLKWTCTCRDCGKQFEIDLPINPVSFFTE